MFTNGYIVHKEVYCPQGGTLPTRRYIVHKVHWYIAHNEVHCPHGGTLLTRDTLSTRRFIVHMEVHCSQGGILSKRAQQFVSGQREDK